MNRSLRPKQSLRPGTALLLIALALGLAGCSGQGFGPGLAGPSADASANPDITVTETVEQTLEEVAEDVEVPVEDPEPPADEPETDAPPAPAEPAAEDCVSYDPANLTVAASGDAWVLRDGGHQMKLFDTQADAEDGRRVARNWRQLCFIGRGNSGPDRYRHMVNYFKEPSGLPLGLAPATIECINYNPNDLDLYSGPAEPSQTESEWALYSGPLPLLFLATEPDAQRARLVAAGYTRLCFVGAGNDRPDPYRYQMEWWRA